MGFWASRRNRLEVILNHPVSVSQMIPTTVTQLPNHTPTLTPLRIAGAAANTDPHIRTRIPVATAIINTDPAHPLSNAPTLMTGPARTTANLGGRSTAT